MTAIPFPSTEARDALPAKILEMPSYSIMIALSGKQEWVRSWYEQTYQELLKAGYVKKIDCVCAKRHFIECVNGAEVHFISTNRGEDAYQLRGIEYDFIETDLSDNLRLGELEILRSHVRGKRPDGTQRGEW